MVDVKADFGAVGDGVTDDTLAFENAIYGSPPSAENIYIFIPPGNYLLSKQLIPRRQVELVGAGMGVTRLTFRNVTSVNATMKGAIALGNQATIAAYNPDPTTAPVAGPDDYVAGGADFSAIRQLEIFIEYTSPTRPAGFDYGIWCAARANIENVHVGYGGFKFVAGAGVGAGNANMCYVANCRSFDAPEHGFYTKGGDANGINFIACKAFRPNKVGFYDLSGFGNTYLGCLREGATGNFESSYKSSGDSNKSLFAMCYDEGDTNRGPHWDVGSPGLILQSTGPKPELNLGPGHNSRLEASFLAGLVTTESINVSANGYGYGIGADPPGTVVPASRLSRDGLYVRAADGSLCSMERRGGDAVYLQRNNDPVMRIQIGDAIADASTAHALNPVFSDTEVEAALNALGAKVNAILARMRALTPTIAS